MINFKRYSKAYSILKRSNDICCLGLSIKYVRTFWCKKTSDL